MNLQRIITIILPTPEAFQKIPRQIAPETIQTLGFRAEVFLTIQAMLFLTSGEALMVQQPTLGQQRINTQQQH